MLEMKEQHDLTQEHFSPSPLVPLLAAPAAGIPFLG